MSTTVPTLEKIREYMTANCDSIVGVPSKKIASRFCDWYENKYNTILYLDDSVSSNTETTIKEHIFNTISSERISDWFKRLYNRRKQKEVKRLEKRNRKIRKIEKLSNVEFFSDESILIAILQFLDTKALVKVRNTCSFFKTFLANHFQIILKNRNILLNMYVCSNNQLVFAEQASCASTYKQVCLISGVESRAVDSLIVARSSKVTVNKNFRVKQFIRLFSVTNRYFQHIFFVRWILAAITNHELLEISECKLNGFYQIEDYCFPDYGEFFGLVPHKVFYMGVRLTDYRNSREQKVRESIKRIHYLVQLEPSDPMYVYICFYNLDLERKDWEKWSALITRENLRLAIETTSEIRILKRNQNASISIDQANQLSERKMAEIRWLVSLAASMKSSNFDAETLEAFNDFAAGCEEIFNK